MREALFIKKNRERWEEIQSRPSSHPDGMAQEFTQLVEDLGYSKTFYPNSKITHYLNTEASKRYLAIYSNKKEKRNRFVGLLKYDIPLMVGKHHRLLFISFCLFVLFVAVGYFSASHDETFVRQVLGNHYVDMTEKNIREGHPFGVYGYGNGFIMFLGIFINNLKVSLFEFAGGALLGIPTVFMLMSNAIMVGVFEFMFFNKGIGGESLLTIMIHGTIELSTFVVSATSGLVLAKSWLFPGRGKRIDALKQGAKEGLIIALSNFPMLLIAAFFEGFITRYAGMPSWLKLLIITASLLLVIGYFVVYPIYLKKHLQKQKTSEAWQ
ncbi:MAG: stage II sporulation protein M [Bacteroidota bacterium]